MSLLRIHASLAEAPARCQWALINARNETVTGEGRLAELPRQAERVQLVLPAAQVLITHARMPTAARRHTGSVLAYAVEDETVGEPDSSQVSWLGTVGDEEALAVVAKDGLASWLNALAAVGIRGCEVHCETLMLPWAAGEWSLAWDGCEGFVRNGDLAGAATDSGDREMPPLSLRLLLEAATACGAGPRSIALYTTAPDTSPDLDAWSRELGVTVHGAGTWDWRTAPSSAGVGLPQERRRWRSFSGALARLKPAAWILGLAMAVQAGALLTERVSLTNAQRVLRQQMESRFRATFPDAVAVVDPALQMRRKLADARHAAGESDSGDFLPMIEQVATAAKELPVGAARAVSFKSGHLTLELGGVDDVSVQRMVARLRQADLAVDAAPAATRAAGVVLIVRTP